MTMFERLQELVSSLQGNNGEASTFCKEFVRILEQCVTASGQTLEGQLMAFSWAINLYTQVRPRLPNSDDVEQMGKVLFQACARAILDRDFPRKITASTLSRFLEEVASACSELSHCGFDHRFVMIQYLVRHPWDHPVLLAMVTGESVDYDEALQYVETGEFPELFHLRLQLLLQSGCEDFALNLCNWCTQHVRFKNDAYIRGNQLVLLFERGYKSIVWDECQSISCCIGKEIVHCLQEDEAHADASLELAQTFIVQDWLRPRNHCCTKELLHHWLVARRQADEESSEFLFNVGKLLEMASNSWQLMALVDAMHFLFGKEFIQFSLEVCVVGLCTDKHNLNLAKQKNETDEMEDIKHRLSFICTVISCISADWCLKLRRLSMLAALSLDPQMDIYKAVIGFLTLDPEEHDRPAVQTVNGVKDSTAVISSATKKDANDTKISYFRVPEVSEATSNTLIAVLSELKAPCLDMELSPLELKLRCLRVLNEKGLLHNTGSSPPKPGVSPIKTGVSPSKKKDVARVNGSPSPGKRNGQLDKNRKSVDVLKDHNHVQDAKPSIKSLKDYRPSIVKPAPAATVAKSSTLYQSPTTKVAAQGSVAAVPDSNKEKFGPQALPTVKIEMDDGTETKTLPEAQCTSSLSVQANTMTPLTVGNKGASKPSQPAKNIVQSTVQQHMQGVVSRPQMASKELTAQISCQQQLTPAAPKPQPIPTNKQTGTLVLDAKTLDNIFYSPSSTLEPTYNKRVAQSQSPKARVAALQPTKKYVQVNQAGQVISAKNNLVTYQVVAGDRSTGQSKPTVVTPSKAAPQALGELQTQTPTQPAVHRQQGIQFLQQQPQLLQTQKQRPAILKKLPSALGSTYQKPSATSINSALQNLQVVSQAQIRLIKPAAPRPQAPPGPRVQAPTVVPQVITMMTPSGLAQQHPSQLSILTPQVVSQTTLVQENVMVKQPMHVNIQTAAHNAPVLCVPSTQAITSMSQTAQHSKGKRLPAKLVMSPPKQGPMGVRFYNTQEKPKAPGQTSILKPIPGIVVSTVQSQATQQNVQTITVSGDTDMEALLKGFINRSGPNVHNVAQVTDPKRKFFRTRTMSLSPANLRNMLFTKSDGKETVIQAPVPSQSQGTGTAATLTLGAQNIVADSVASLSGAVDPGQLPQALIPAVTADQPKDRNIFSALTPTGSPMAQLLSRGGEPTSDDLYFQSTSLVPESTPVVEGTAAGVSSQLIIDSDIQCNVIEEQFVMNDEKGLTSPGLCFGVPPNELVSSSVSADPDIQEVAFVPPLSNQTVTTTESGAPFVGNVQQDAAPREATLPVNFLPCEPTSSIGVAPYETVLRERAPAFESTPNITGSSEPFFSRSELVSEPTRNGIILPSDPTLTRIDTPSELTLTEQSASLNIHAPELTASFIDQSSLVTDQPPAQPAFFGERPPEPANPRPPEPANPRPPELTEPKSDQTPEMTIPERDLFTQPALSRKEKSPHVTSNTPTFPIGVQPLGQVVSMGDQPPEPVLVMGEKPPGPELAMGDPTPDLKPPIDDPTPQPRVSMDDRPPEPMVTMDDQPHHPNVPVVDQPLEEKLPIDEQPPEPTLSLDDQPKLSLLQGDRPPEPTLLKDDQPPGLTLSQGEQPPVHTLPQGEQPPESTSSLGEQRPEPTLSLDEQPPEHTLPHGEQPPEQTSSLGEQHPEHTLPEGEQPPESTSSPGEQPPEYTLPQGEQPPEQTSSLGEQPPELTSSQGEQPPEPTSSIDKQSRMTATPISEATLPVDEMSPELKLSDEVPEPVLPVSEVPPEASLQVSDQPQELSLQSDAPPNRTLPDQIPEPTPSSTDQCAQLASTENEPDDISASYPGVTVATQAEQSDSIDDVPQEEAPVLDQSCSSTLPPSLIGDLAEQSPSQENWPSAPSRRSSLRSDVSQSPRVSRMSATASDSETDDSCQPPELTCSINRDDQAMMSSSLQTIEAVSSDESYDDSPPLLFDTQGNILSDPAALFPPVPALTASDNSYNEQHVDGHVVVSRPGLCIIQKDPVSVASTDSSNIKRSTTHPNSDVSTDQTVSPKRDVATSGPCDIGLGKRLNLQSDADPSQGLKFSDENTNNECCVIPTTVNGGQVNSEDFNVQGGEYNICKPSEMMPADMFTSGDDEQPSEIAQSGSLSDFVQNGGRGDQQPEEQSEPTLRSTQDETNTHTEGSSVRRDAEPVTSITALTSANQSTNDDLGVSDTTADGECRETPGHGTEIADNQSTPQILGAEGCTGGEEAEIQLEKKTLGRQGDGHLQGCEEEGLSQLGTDEFQETSKSRSADDTLDQLNSVTEDPDLAYGNNCSQTPETYSGEVDSISAAPDAASTAEQLPGNRENTCLETPIVQMASDAPTEPGSTLQTDIITDANNHQEIDSQVDTLSETTDNLKTVRTVEEQQQQLSLSIEQNNTVKPAKQDDIQDSGNGEPVLFDLEEDFSQTSPEADNPTPTPSGFDMFDTEADRLCVEDDLRENGEIDNNQPMVNASTQTDEEEEEGSSGVGSPLPVDPQLTVTKTEGEQEEAREVQEEPIQETKEKEDKDSPEGLGPDQNYIQAVPEKVDPIATPCVAVGDTVDNHGETAPAPVETEPVKESVKDVGTTGEDHDDFLYPDSDEEVSFRITNDSLHEDDAMNTSKPVEKEDTPKEKHSKAPSPVGNVEKKKGGPLLSERKCSSSPPTNTEQNRTSPKILKSSPPNSEGAKRGTGTWIGYKMVFMTDKNKRRSPTNSQTGQSDLSRHSQYSVGKASSPSVSPVAKVVGVQKVCVSPKAKVAVSVSPKAKIIPVKNATNYIVKIRPDSVTVSPQIVQDGKSDRKGETPKNTQTKSQIGESIPKQKEKTVIGYGVEAVQKGPEKIVKIESVKTDRRTQERQERKDKEERDRKSRDKTKREERGRKSHEKTTVEEKGRQSQDRTKTEERDRRSEDRTKREERDRSHDRTKREEKDRSHDRTKREEKDRSHDRTKREEKDRSHDRTKREEKDRRSQDRSKSKEHNNRSHDRTKGEEQDRRSKERTKRDEQDRKSKDRTKREEQDRKSKDRTKRDEQDRRSRDRTKKDDQDRRSNDRTKREERDRGSQNKPKREVKGSASQDRSRKDERHRHSHDRPKTDKKDGSSYDSKTKEERRTTNQEDKTKDKKSTTQSNDKQYRTEEKKKLKEDKTRDDKIREKTPSEKETKRNNSEQKMENEIPEHAQKVQEHLQSTGDQDRSDSGREQVSPETPAQVGRKRKSSVDQEPVRKSSRRSTQMDSTASAFLQKLSRSAKHLKNVDGVTKNTKSEETNGEDTSRSPDQAKGPCGSRARRFSSDSEGAGRGRRRRVSGESFQSDGSSSRQRALLQGTGSTHSRASSVSEDYSDSAYDNSSLSQDDSPGDGTATSKRLGRRENRTLKRIRNSPGYVPEKVERKTRFGFLRHPEREEQAERKRAAAAAAAAAAAPATTTDKETDLVVKHRVKDEQTEPNLSEGAGNAPGEAGNISVAEPTAVGSEGTKRGSSFQQTYTSWFKTRPPTEASPKEEEKEEVFSKCNCHKMPSKYKCWNPNCSRSAQVMNGPGNAVNKPSRANDPNVRSRNLTHPNNFEPMKTTSSSIMKTSHIDTKRKSSPGVTQVIDIRHAADFWGWANKSNNATDEAVVKTERQVVPQLVKPTGQPPAKGVKTPGQFVAKPVKPIDLTALKAVTSDGKLVQKPLEKAAQKVMNSGNQLLPKSYTSNSSSEFSSFAPQKVSDNESETSETSVSSVRTTGSSSSSQLVKKTPGKHDTDKHYRSKKSSSSSLKRSLDRPGTEDGSSGKKLRHGDDNTREDRPTSDVRLAGDKPGNKSNKEEIQASLSDVSDVEDSFQKSFVDWTKGESDPTVDRYAHIKTYGRAVRPKTGHRINNEGSSESRTKPSDFQGAFQTFVSEPS